MNTKTYNGIDKFIGFILRICRISVAMYPLQSLSVFQLSVVTINYLMRYTTNSFYNKLYLVNVLLTL